MDLLLPLIPYGSTHFYKLNVNLNGSQNIAILEIIVSKLNEYNKLHEIPENDHSFSDNRDNFDWDDTRN